MINLFVNYFDHGNSERKKEIEFCFEKNKKNKFIDKIIVVNRGDRASYGDFFRAMTPYYKDVNIIANTDIYFDNTVQLAAAITERQCFALTRWEDINGKIIEFHHRHNKRAAPPQWSQDAWIFRGSTNAKFYDNVEAIRGKNQREIISFCLGIPGCDNKFAALLKEKGFEVTNPCKSIRAIHKHKNEDRSYPDYQILKGIRPHGLVHPVKL